MPEKYICVNIGIDGYPVWLILSEKSTIAVIQPTTCPDKVECSGAIKTLVTTVTLVLKGCCVEAKTPASVENVCAILGFTYQGDVAAEPTQPAPPDAKPERGE